MRWEGMAVFCPVYRIVWCWSDIMAYHVICDVYIQNEDLMRQLVELGYRGSGEALKRYTLFMYFFVMMYLWYDDDDAMSWWDDEVMMWWRLLWCLWADAQWFHLCRYECVVLYLSVQLCCCLEYLMDVAPDIACIVAVVVVVFVCI